MAHRRHHKRHSRRSRVFGFLKLPSISGQTKDAGIGALLGVGGAGAAMFAANQYNEAQAAKNGTLLGPAVLLWTPAIGGVLAGAGAYYLGKKKNSGKAATHFFSAAIAGIVISGFKWIQQNFSQQFGDLVKVRLAGYGNVLVKQGALGNLLISPGGGGGSAGSPVRKARLGRLAAAAMSPAARAAMGGYMRVTG